MPFIGRRGGVPVVTPLDVCIARPSDVKGVHPLVEHLEAVAAGWGSPDGDKDQQLKFLAGLLHDVGKAHTKWQHYIKLPPGQRKKGPPHSPAGSALFCYCAVKMLDHWQVRGDVRKRLRRLTMGLARDIYDHHGRLGDIGREVPWANSLFIDFFKHMDLPGLFSLVSKHFPFCEPRPEEVPDWFAAFPAEWEQWSIMLAGYERRRLERETNRYVAASRAALRTVTAGLIKADRYHASGIRPVYLDSSLARQACDRLHSLCLTRGRRVRRRGGAGELAGLRQWLQDAALDNYLKSRRHRFFSLLLPTGLGKTLTSLRLALTACAGTDSGKVIYVAPYLSILSQATREIRAYTGLEVVQHHHLSVIDEAGRVGDDEDVFFLALEAWQAAPVITTTFNQLFRALFPQRAQQTLRLKGFHKAFLIIDEPQIIDGPVWNLFLQMLAAAAREYDMRILFTTATLPPLHIGLTMEKVVALAPPFNAPNRYMVETLGESLDCGALVDKVEQQMERVGSAAVIMNTIRDAAEVYAALRDVLPEGVRCVNLSGCMTPLHKSSRISEIISRLEQAQPTVVVCTQILEAGVDLSFRVVFRALPILTSVAQAAGRANRHAEGEAGRVIVFHYLRDGKTDTRRHVYRSAINREETDACLRRCPQWEEPAMTGMVNDYYKNCFARNTQTALYEHLVDAACGAWSKLAGIEPFGRALPRFNLFVPWGEGYLDKHGASWMQRYAPEGAEQLYEKFAAREHLQMDFIGRKRFMALLQHFLVPIPPESAVPLAASLSDTSISRLVDPDMYSDETGLGHILGRSEEDTPAYIW